MEKNINELLLLLLLEKTIRLISFVRIVQHLGPLVISRDDLPSLTKIGVGVSESRKLATH